MTVFPTDPPRSVTGKNTIIIGLGNPILSDDSVGVKAARRLSAVLKDRDGVEVVEAYAGGLRLLDVLVGYQRAIIIDAMQTGAAPGTVRKFSISDLPKTRNLASTHDADLPTALEAGRALGMKLPEEITVFGIEAAEVENFGEELTPEVERGMEKAVEQIVRIL
jgi:hydrogenase maturation protease